MNIYYLTYKNKNVNWETVLNHKIYEKEGNPKIRGTSQKNIIESETLETSRK